MRRFNKDTPLSERTTITKQRDVVRSMISKHGIICPCGKKMNPNQVQNRDEDIYHHCIYCGYHYDYEKILKQVDGMRNNVV